jgi:3-methylcrotonyl-CoA carboxylase alpha subunit
MFKSLLIANRGEIACRIARTARRMGLNVVAVYSAADKDALHVRAADVAYPIGPAPAAESYLKIEKIIDAAKASGAEAIHPGYGFLAENARFAEACGRAGIAFVGPPPTAIRLLGEKNRAKTLMAKAGVPVVPGYHGNDQRPATLKREADRLGYPVLIKAAAGGGGKGMRRVERARDFLPALESAKREAEAAFGAGMMLVEKYIERPRHIEVQIVADRHGNVAHLFERDCSLQRRHQKVIEEAPAPGITADFRRRVCAAAVTAARAAHYVGAGTVEFIVDIAHGIEAATFAFMEVNTRLQVEHPVTEFVTGQDLVEWQLRIAAGERLPRRQDKLALSGHAIEVRLYAEDPARGFVPQAGRLDRLRLPATRGPVRVDTGVAEGDTVTVHYDPMIAKMIAHGADRAAALAALSKALAQTEVAGITTNLGFLTALVEHPAFVGAELDTGLIGRLGDEIARLSAGARDRLLACGVIASLLGGGASGGPADGDPYSPWAERNGWTLMGPRRDALALTVAGMSVPTHVLYRGAGRFVVELGGRLIELADCRRDGDRFTATVDGRPVEARVFDAGGDTVAVSAGRSVAFHRRSVAEEGGDERGASGAITAPMPGKIVAVAVKKGAPVKRGDPVIVLEAMKMEQTLAAPRDGRVATVACRPGDLVVEGALLAAVDGA